MATPRLSRTSTDAGNDYQPLSGTLTFKPGETSKLIAVGINGDTLVEPDETFVVNLSNPTGGAGIGDNQGVATIRNDDTALLVISQVYGGGGNSSAQFKNDFIEIFNRGTTTVDLTGWSVQEISDAGGGTWAVTPLCATGPCLLNPGKYFLVQEAAGAGAAQSIPAPDTAGTINLGGTTGKVALVSNTIALSGSCPSSSSILDLLGYGTTASCFEGTAHAPSPSNTSADFRKSGGCVDSNDNAADFVVAAPNPRNSGAPVNDCSTGFRPDISINNVSVTEGDSATVNASFNVTLSAVSMQTITVAFATADGNATAGSDYQSNAGTLTFNPGELSKPINVSVSGDILDEPNETFTVNLFNATNAAILDSQGQGTITDNDPTPSLYINDLPLIPEGDSGTSTANFTVTLSAASGQTVTVNYATADGTANAGSDYVAAAGTLTFNPGDLTKQVPVKINGDSLFEPNETFFVNITAPVNATLSDNQGQGTITNDDAAPPTSNITIDDPSVAEGDAETKSLVFMLSLSIPSESPVTVDYATTSAAPASGVATSGADYVSAAGTITFDPGQTSKPLSITINGDKLVEPNETFFVNLTNASPGSTITDAQGTGTIINDDTPLIVISQVYGGGGNSSATYINDFIEIFNRGVSTVDFAVTPYSLQYAAATSAFGTNKTDITSGTLAPGHYFLIQEASGGAGGSPLPVADANGTINLAATAGKVALVSGTTLLSTLSCPGDDGVSPFNSNLPSIADFLVVRTTSCNDTNVNAADFTNPTTAPVARNTGSPLTSCP